MHIQSTLSQARSWAVQNRIAVATLFALGLLIYIITLLISVQPNTRTSSGVNTDTIRPHYAAARAENESSSPRTNTQTSNTSPSTATPVTNDSQPTEQPQEVAVPQPQANIPTGPVSVPVLQTPNGKPENQTNTKPNSESSLLERVESVLSPLLGR